MSSKENVAIASRLFREHGAIIRSIAKQYVRCESDVDDMYQDIFLSIVRSPPSHETSLLTYFKTVVRNHVQDSYRRKASRNGFAKRYGELLQNTVRSVDPKSKYHQTEQVKRALDVIESALPPYVGRVLISRYVHGRSVDEIALELGLEKRTVSRYCCVGLKRLRDLLDE